MYGDPNKPEGGCDAVFEADWLAATEEGACDAG